MHGLVRYKPVRSEDSAQEFFRRAYELVVNPQPWQPDSRRRSFLQVLWSVAFGYEDPPVPHGSQRPYVPLTLAEADRKGESDREIFFRYAEMIAKERGLNASDPNDARLALCIVGIFLSLGLETAAEGNLSVAVELLRGLDLVKFIQIGHSLHEGVWKAAKPLGAKLLLTVGKSSYGLLPEGQEQSVRDLASSDFLFQSQREFLLAKRQLASASARLALGEQFPLASMLAVKSFPVSHYERTHRRDGTLDPSPFGDVLSLVIRSFLWKASLNQEPWHKGSTLGTVSAFMQEHIFLREKELQEVDVPSRRWGNRRHMDEDGRAAIRALVGYVQMSKKFDPDKNEKQPAVIAKADEAVLDLVLTEVSAWFRQLRLEAMEASIRSGEERLWGFTAQQVLVHGPGIEEMLFSGSVVQNPSILRQVQPEKLSALLAACGQWPEQTKAQARGQIDWRAVFHSALAVETKAQIVARAAEGLGEDLLVDVLAASPSLILLLSVWTQSSASGRRALLEMVRDVGLRFETVEVVNAVSVVPETGGDERFLMLLLSRAGSFTETDWGALLQVFEREQATVKQVFDLIPAPLKLRAYLSANRAIWHRFSGLSVAVSDAVLAAIQMNDPQVKKEAFPMCLLEHPLMPGQEQALPGSFGSLPAYDQTLLLIEVSVSSLHSLQGADPLVEAWSDTALAGLLHTHIRTESKVRYELPVLLSEIPLVRLGRVFGALVRADRERIKNLCVDRVFKALLDDGTSSHAAGALLGRLLDEASLTDRPSAFSEIQSFPEDYRSSIRWKVADRCAEVMQTYGATVSGWKSLLRYCESPSAGEDTCRRILKLFPIKDADRLLEGWDTERVRRLAAFAPVDAFVYRSYALASAAAKRIGMQKPSEYAKQREQDSRLPAEPADQYRDQFAKGGDWAGFLGVERTGFYETYDEAAAAARRLGIMEKDVGANADKARLLYEELYLEEDFLPPYPDECYASVWEERGEWAGFLGIGPYITWEETSSAARVLGIRSPQEYGRLSHKDKRLPGDLPKYFEDEWVSRGAWDGFLRIERPAPFPTMEEAKKAIESWEETPQANTKRTEDYVNHLAYVIPSLPLEPAACYASAWQEKGGWAYLLDHAADSKKQTKPYLTLAEASAYVRSLGIKTPEEYRERAEHDPVLPKMPATYVYYKGVWRTSGGWDGFLGFVRPASYETLMQAREACHRLDCYRKSQYLDACYADTRLPLYPEVTYASEWKTPRWGDKIEWAAFIEHVPRAAPYQTVQEASAAAQRMGLRHPAAYARDFKKDPRLPSNPKTAYADAWIGFGEEEAFYGVRRANPYPSFEEAAAAIRRLEFLNAGNYDAHSLADPRLPRHPWKAYPEDWKRATKGTDGRGGGLWEFIHYSRLSRGGSTSDAKENSGEEPQAEPKGTEPNMAASRPVAKKRASDASVDRERTPQGIGEFSELMRRARAKGALTRDSYLWDCHHAPGGSNAFPLDPDLKYPQAWKQVGGWDGFLGVTLEEPYATWEEASASAIRLGFKDMVEYKKYHPRDPRLPRDPSKTYESVWKGKGGAYGFLGRETPKKKEKEKTST
ncbi:hypothetical protein HYV73_03065 [Candidatus Uhrbacteria bacterium]|nr:hypothetical protein [Candidatus Uhrbacteria bacterium]